MKTLRRLCSAFLMLLMSTLLPAVATAANRTFTVVIDAGHGGKDAGASENGVNEKDINLSVALKLAKKIKEKLPNVNTVLTRSSDQFLSLQERANKANKAKGDLFISIHTNSIDKKSKGRSTISGASTYALGLHKDKNNMEVARRENSVIELEKDYHQKYSGFDPNSDESYIIFEMAQKKNLSRSIHFAELVQKQLKSKAGRTDRGVRQAGFWVLWATSMPAVLVELDFICNPNSAKFMASDKGSSQLADGLLEAVAEYARIATTNPSQLDTKIEEPEAAEEQAPLAEIGTSNKPPRQVSDAPAPSVSRQTSVKRRRRNSVAKELSSKQNYEKADINVYTESEPARKVEPEEKVVASTEEKSEEKPVTPAPKAVNANKKVQQRQERTVGNRKVVVSNSADARETLATQKKRKSVTRQEHLVTVYKIQILSVPAELPANAPDFKGLSPVSYIKEGGRYKYTYGESTSRTEINKLLKEVRTRIPDAFVITTTKTE